MASSEGSMDFCVKSVTSHDARRAVGHCGEFYGVKVAIEVGEDCKGSLKPLPLTVGSKMIRLQAHRSLNHL